jgi:hypothetical protein
MVGDSILFLYRERRSLVVSFSSSTGREDDWRTILPLCRGRMI